MISVVQDQRLESPPGKVRKKSSFRSYHGIWLLLLIPLSLIFLVIARNWPWAAEYIFARGYYRVLGNFLTLVTRWLPFSLAEWLIVLLPLGILLCLILWIRHIFKAPSGSKGRVIIQGLVYVGALISVVAFLIISTAMVNSYRYSFAKQSGLVVETYSLEELVSLCQSLTQEAIEAREQVTEDSQGVADLDMDFATMSQKAKEAYDVTAKTYPVLDLVYDNSKSVFFSRYMSYSNFIGVYTPFTMEANVDTDIPGYKQPATVCHELAHIQGFMLEDEANYISYLVCRDSTEPVFRYSGVISVLNRAMNQLYETDQEKYQEIVDSYSQGMKRDAAVSARYWEEIRSNEAAQTVENVTSTVDDAYLKVSGQSQGMKSYGLVVDLLLARQRQMRETN